MLLRMFIVELLCQALMIHSLPLGTAEEGGGVGGEAQPSKKPKRSPCVATCPDDWIQFIWDVFTLMDSSKDSVNSEDVDRLFYAMDMDANNMVEFTEFEPFWRDCSLICDPDIRAIFSIFTKGDAVISRQEIFDVFSLGRGESFTRTEFDDRFNEILDTLPNKGCPITTNPPTSCPAFMAFG